MFERLASKRKDRVSGALFALALHAGLVLSVVTVGAAAQPFELPPLEINAPWTLPIHAFFVPTRATGNAPRAEQQRAQKARARLARLASLFADEPRAARSPDVAPAPSSPPVAAAGIATVAQGGCAGPGCDGVAAAALQKVPVQWLSETILAPPTQSLTQPRPDPACGAPSMPEAARLTGTAGRVLVSYTVHSDGRVDSVRPLDPAAPPVLVEAVRGWLSSCRFEPALLDGEPVPARIEQPYVFKLR